MDKSKRSCQKESVRWVKAEEREREREREREKDRQTDRQTDIQPDTQGEGVRICKT